MCLKLESDFEDDNPLCPQFWSVWQWKILNSDVLNSEKWKNCQPQLSILFDDEMFSIYQNYNW